MNVSAHFAVRRFPAPEGSIEQSAKNATLFFFPVAFAHQKSRSAKPQSTFCESDRVSSSRID